jgi:hypothetical protein
MSMGRFPRGTVVLVNRGYGVEEPVLLKYYVNSRWARGVSLEHHGRWHHFDTMRCRKAESFSHYDYVKATRGPMCKHGLFKCRPCGGHRL